jgi:hypothetical protein
MILGQDSVIQKETAKIEKKDIFPEFLYIFTENSQN